MSQNWIIGICSKEYILGHIFWGQILEASGFFVVVENE
jgi:hypothetical protein